MRPSRRHRCSCWLRHRCSCWLRHRCSCWLRHRCSCWLRHRCSGRRWAPPARSPSALRASLGASARSPARPRGPVGALHTGGAWCALRVTRPGTLRPQPLRCLIAAPAINVACNSPATISNHENLALGLQRFLALLNLRPIELHATFVWLGPVVCRETITACALLSRSVRLRPSVFAS